jgi:CPA2 family monovalent cation:H+ antiporter-2
MVVATSATIDVRQMVTTARALNPAIEIVLRSHNEAEAELLEQDNAGKIFLGEKELADAMTRYVLARNAAATAL